MIDKHSPKIAIVADWLTNMGGAEMVVLAFHEAFPDAPIYTSVYNPEKMPAFAGLDVRTTYLQRLPKFLRNFHKFFPMLRVHAFRKLDLSEFDIILSSSSAEAKQVRKTRPGQIHICYCHTPIRYYWSHYKGYKADPGFGKLNWLVRLAMPLMVPPLKRADYKAAQEVDYFIGNSTVVQDRITTFYKRTSALIHPPVNTKRFHLSAQSPTFYMTLGRQVPYKHVDLAVAACTQLGLPLKVFGDGSEHERLVAMAGPTVEFYTDRFSDASDEAVAIAFKNAKGLIFPSEEDFGIVPVEAMAAGVPVIAYKEGGIVDTVTDGETGILFAHQTTQSLIGALQKAETSTFIKTALRNRAKRYDTTLFVTKIRHYVTSAYQRAR